MRTVHKYEVLFDTLYISEFFYFSLAADSKILHFGLDPNRYLSIWAEVETERDVEMRKFQLVGTGREITNPEAFHLGTCVVGPYVWHLYEIPK